MTQELKSKIDGFDLAVKWHFDNPEYFRGVDINDIKDPRSGFLRYEQARDDKLKAEGQKLMEMTDYSPLPTSSQLKADGWQLVGTIDVDAGIVMVGDPCYASVDEGQNPKEQHPIHDWHKFCASIGGQYPTAMSIKHAGQEHTGAGVVVSSGEGDGSYPVYVRYHLDHTWGRPIRRIAEMRVVFMGEYDEDDDDTL